MKILATHSVNEKYGEDLSSETLRSTYFPSPHYGVSVQFHKGGMKFTTLIFQALVISRAGVVVFENTSYRLRVEEGRYGKLPGGEYSVSVESECDSETVYVYDLDEIGKEIEERENKDKVE